MYDADDPVCIVCCVAVSWVVVTSTLLRASGGEVGAELSPCLCLRQMMMMMTTMATIIEGSRGARTAMII